MNNLKNNTKRVPRQLARRKTAHGCEPSSLKLSSQLSSLLPILSDTDGDTTRTFTYHADGQLASATVGGGHRTPRTPSETETFLWDGLALIPRGDEQFINEPHIGNAPQKLCFGGEPRAKRSARRARKGPRGNHVASSKGTSYFNDALGTTVGSKKDGKYSAAALTAFGENLSVDSPTPTQNSNFFTGKPFVEGLGHAFWMCTISVEVVVNVAFAEQLKDSSQFAQGDIARYIPHHGPSGGLIAIVCNNPDDTCIREAVVAHEYGHADYATSTICADLRSSLLLLEARWNLNQWWSEAEVRHEINAIIKMEAINSVIGFWNAANDPTIVWFQSSPEWRFVHDDKTAGYWEWVKE